MVQPSVTLLLRLIEIFPLKPEFQLSTISVWACSQELAGKFSIKMIAIKPNIHDMLPASLFGKKKHCLQYEALRIITDYQISIGT